MRPTLTLSSGGGQAPAIDTTPAVERRRLRRVVRERRRRDRLNRVWLDATQRLFVGVRGQKPQAVYDVASGHKPAAPHYLDRRVPEALARGVSIDHAERTTRDAVTEYFAALRAAVGIDRAA